MIHTGLRTEQEAVEKKEVSTSGQDEPVDVELGHSEQASLHHDLQGRHMQMIAIGLNFLSEPHRNSNH